MLTWGPSLRGQDHAGSCATDVERRRLTDAVLATGPGGLCLIAAPRGYGATTAVARALAAEPSVRWCGLERSDLGELRSNLATVLGVAGADSGSLDRVLEALAAQPPGWLVIDGAGDGSAGCHGWEAVRQLAQRLPLACRLVVIAVQSPPATMLALAGRPGSRLLTTGDLRCSDDEALAVLEHTAPGIDIDVARGIYRAADGWVTAISAAAAHARSATAEPQWLLTAGPEALLGARLQELPAQVRRFLIDTAELDLLSADLAAAVSGTPDAAQLLRWLDDRLMYLQEAEPPAGMRGRWWRRHPLLTAALRNRVGAGGVEQHNRAAQWFAANGDVHTTLHHLLAAGRAADAGRYLTAHEAALFADGRVGEALHWYRQLPGAWNSDADHLVRLAWGQVLTGDVSTAVATLGRLDVQLATGPRPDRSTLPMPDAELDLDGEKELLRAFLAGFHADPATMISASRRADAALFARPERPASQLAPLLTVRGLLWAGRTAAALAEADAVMTRGYGDDGLRESHRRGVRALALAGAGRVREARLEADLAAAWVADQQLDPFDIQFMPAAAARARVLLECGDLGAATDLAARLAAAAAGAGHRGQQIEMMLVLATAATAAEDLAQAVGLLGQAREVALDSCPRSGMVGLIDEQMARARIAAGDLLRAQRLAQDVPSQVVRTLLLGRASVPTQPVAVIRSAEALRPATPRLAVERHLLLATAHIRSSRKVAQAHLRQGAALARQYGLALAMTGAAADLVALARATACETQDDALAWLLQQSDRGSGSGTGDGGTAETPLSRGELHLLSLLPRRPRYHELAEELGVSINTVKTRLRKLYAKLGAGGRDEAVDRARQRGLLPPG